MLQTVKVTKNNKDLEEIKALYESAFPEKERIAFGFIMDYSDESNEGFEVLAMYDGELFVGFVITINSDDISQIGYFAVNEKLRSKGYGSEILKSLHQSKPEKRFMADVENPDVECDNKEQREKRVKFYYRNGYQKTDIEYKWKGEDYWILSYNGNISKEENEAFWKQRVDILKKAENYNK